MKTVKLAVVEVLDSSGNPLENFIYINGELTEIRFEEELLETIPMNCLNQVYLSELMPKTEKEFDEVE